MNELNLLVAFLAGLASFLAPCVIPLVPAFIGYISRVSVEELTNSQSAAKYRAKVLINSLFYVAGFSLVFVLLGLGATTLSHLLLLNRQILLKIGGVLVIFFGLYSLGVFNRFRFTQIEFQFQLPERLRTIKLLGPFLLGTTFALAWTPCVGPILGAILTLAATAGNILSGVTLLFVYSLGISLPFILIALTLSSSYRLLINLRRTLLLINTGAGILLVIIGLLLVTDKYGIFTAFILAELNKIDFYRNLQNSF
ncbi:cytochrome c biogenesis protein CcdA [Candidatus Microgenomates bacterium]|nr:cytochrome c biogenesis protein CcdA [Candidatus Microgenomates bacterium]